MTDTTTHLTRLRTRLLAAAYANADFWTRRTALLTDQSLAALARRDPTAAEDLAARQLAPEFLHDTQILGAAIDAGIDTGHWEERREKIRADAREASELAPQSDPATEAKRIWAPLYDHYPTIAAALIDFLTDLPPTWREDLFTRSSLSPAPPARRHRSSLDRKPRRTTTSPSDDGLVIGFLSRDGARQYPSRSTSAIRRLTRSSSAKPAGNVVPDVGRAARI